MQIGLPEIFGLQKTHACVPSGRHLNHQSGSHRYEFFRNSIGSRKWAALCALQLLPAIAFGQSNDLADRLIRTYSPLESYCDEGFFYREPSSIGAVLSSGRTFERCVTKDGSFKVAYRNDADVSDIDVRWQDEHSYHWYDSDSGRYRPQYERRTLIEQSDKREVSDVVDTVVPLDDQRKTEPVPPVLDMVLNRTGYTFFNVGSFEEWLGGFQLKADLSDASLIAFERMGVDWRPTERIWISRDDGMIRRVWDASRGGMEIVTIRTNGSLTNGDLSFEVPTAILLRYEAKGNPGLVVVTLSFVCFALGFLYWRSRYRTTGAKRLCKEASIFLLRASIGALVPALLYAIFVTSDESALGVVQLFGPFGWLALYVFLLWLAVMFASAQPIARIRLRATAHEPVLPKVDCAILDETSGTRYTRRIWPAALAMSGSAAVFLLAIGHTHRWPDGDWSGLKYKEYRRWPEWIPDVPGTLNIGSQYLDLIVATVAVLGIGLIAYWLKRSRSKQLLWSVLLLWFIWAVCLLAVNRATSDSSKYDSRVYGAPFDWLYWNAIYSKWGTPLWTAFLANVISAFVLAGCLVFLVQQHRNRQIRWPALTVLFVSSLVSYGVITGGRGGGFEGWSGWPFMWYWWFDMGDYSKYSALYANIAFAVVSVCGLTFITEWMHQLRSRYVVGSILVVFVGLAVVMLFWVTPEPGRYSMFQTTGAPFFWDVDFGYPRDYSNLDLLVLLHFLWWPVLGNIMVAYFIVSSLGFIVYSVGSYLKKVSARFVELPATAVSDK